MERVVKCNWLDEVGELVQDCCSSSSQPDVNQPAARLPPDSCSIHPAIQKEYFCMDCDSCICSDCAILSNTHHNHHVTKATSVAKDKRVICQLSLISLEDLLERIKLMSISCASDVKVLQQKRSSTMTEMKRVTDHVS